jgi:hypothetical protein
MEARRRIMERKRTSPEDMVRPRLTIHADGSERWLPAVGNESDPVPSQIWIYLDGASKNDASEPKAASTGWNFPQWLDGAQAKWGGYPLDIVFISFGVGFMKPEFLDDLQVLSARQLRWNSKLLTDGQNLTSTAAIDALLASSLAEVVVYVAGVGESTMNTRALQVTKDLVDLRTARGQNRPNIICRICPNPADGQKMITEISQWVRQAGIDRLEVSDKVTEEKRLWGS